MVKAAHAAQAVSGAIQTAQGQGSPETSKATGSAIANLMAPQQQAA